MKANKELLRVVAQGFYGNRTETDIEVKNLDRFILGYIDDNIPVTEKIDRTIVKIPDTNNIVIVYNKYQEEERLKEKENLLKNKNYELKPLAVIPENNLKLYSRCIVCRMNEDGKFENLQHDDFEKFMKYLVE